MIDAWLLARALPAPGITTSWHQNDPDRQKPEDDDEEERADKMPEEEVSGKRNSRTFSCGSKSSNSGSGTPVRKISAHEFEKGGLIKPIVTTIDGTPTFLSPQVSSDLNAMAIRKRSRHDVQGLKETDLIFELVKDICDDLDIRRLCHKILQNVGILTNADRYTCEGLDGGIRSETYPGNKDKADVVDFV